MKFVVTGSLGNISKPLATKLVAAGHEVTVVSSNPDRKKEIEALGAKAAIGYVTDANFLSQSFTGADAVYTMIPPNFGASEWKKYIASVGEIYAEAIRISGVKNVVNLSSIGAHMQEGCGPVSGLYFSEKALNGVPGLNVIHLRPGFFYSNFYANIGMIRHMGFMGGNYGQSNITLAHTNDIAEVAASKLQMLNFRGTSFQYIISDEKTPGEIASTIGSAIGNPELKWVDFPDEQNLNGMIQAGLPKEIAENYTEMGSAMRSGAMTSDYAKAKIAERGPTKLEHFAKEFASVYKKG